MMSLLTKMSAELANIQLSVNSRPSTAPPRGLPPLPRLLPARSADAALCPLLAPLALPPLLRLLRMSPNTPAMNWLYLGRSGRPADRCRPLLLLLLPRRRGELSGVSPSLSLLAPAGDSAPPGHSSVFRLLWKMCTMLLLLWMRTCFLTPAAPGVPSSDASPARPPPGPSRVCLSADLSGTGLPLGRVVAAATGVTGDASPSCCCWWSPGCCCRPAEGGVLSICSCRRVSTMAPTCSYGQLLYLLLQLTGTSGYYLALRRCRFSFSAATSAAYCSKQKRSATPAVHQKQGIFWPCLVAAW
jgi:hypothetical protein